MHYRNDIAGLRAVAVLPILLLHAGFDAIPGGFLGVDIFFVVSGYLISRILIGEMTEQRFTLAGFYRRRALRILPALLVMLVAVLAVGWWRLFPQDMRDLSWSAAAAALSGSNIWFWRNVSYFGDAELTPLLHSWSLGVEEQFYLFYPLLLLALHRWLPRRIVACLWGLTIGSFVLSYGLVFAGKAPAAFYLLPSRAWELGLGALVAAGGFPALGARIRGVAAWAGLAMIAASLVLVTEKSAVPAPWALLPCLGTALLIAYGEAAGTAKLLALAPLRFVGDISYSLYLWHWPVMAFWRLERGLTLDAGEMAAAIAISFALAILSYRLVERPFLDRGRAAPTRRVLWSAAAAMLVVAGSAAALALAAARTPIADPRVARVMAFIDYPLSRDAELYFNDTACRTDGRYLAQPCATTRADRPNILIFGDSHAQHIASALAERLDGVHAMRVATPLCRPLLPDPDPVHCAEVMERGFGEPAGDGTLSRAILSARWEAGDAPALERAVRHFRARGVAVTILGPGVEYDEPVPRLIARAMARGNDWALVRQGRRRDLIALDRAMARRAAAWGATYVSMQDLECPAGTCALFAADGSPYHFDKDHYTIAASRELVAKIPAAALAANPPFPK
ncbi:MULTISPECIES: acyltransferase family protein [unclassified Sphingopyxis]|uniref:acyltransferase family protein n=1 Tax=unclassified Sphingopyxis TaxID=2614943 RepID=UPI000736C0D3|nr:MULTISPECIES: acyltransferase family protein [unclassified Sphingopyxis]KTE44297.1 hypothetical protein ATE62_03590 [Sphingopyxis sp. HIX]KTE85946.1 hypothetical protein ATE72_01550 [Sphingopyxis sp. HXXIV]